MVDLGDTFCLAGSVAGVRVEEEVVDFARALEVDVPILVLRVHHLHSPRLAIIACASFNNGTHLEQTEQQARRKVPHPKLSVRKRVPIPKYLHYLSILPHSLLEMLIALRTDRGICQMQCAEGLHRANHRGRRPRKIREIAAVWIDIDMCVIDNQKTRHLVDEMGKVMLVGTLYRQRWKVRMENGLLETELSLP
jgi:hypothetical protein